MWMALFMTVGVMVTMPWKRKVPMMTFAMLALLTEAPPIRMADTAGSVQEATSFLPDYAFAGSDSAAGTSVSGLVGSAMVAGVAVLICVAGGFFRKRRTNAK